MPFQKYKSSQIVNIQEALKKQDKTFQQVHLNRPQAQSGFDNFLLYTDMVVPSQLKMMSLGNIKSNKQYVKYRPAIGPI